MDPVQTELTLDQELDALDAATLPTAKPAAAPAPAAVVPPAATVPAAPALPAVPETPVVAEVSLDDKLKTIDETPAPAPKPELTVEQQQILAVVPNPQVAERLQTLANGYANFTETYARGDFEATEQMLHQWNPAAHEAFEEHIYQKYVAPQNSQWINRWIQEEEAKQSGNGGQLKGMKTLENTVRQLQQKLEDREREEQTAAKARHQQQLASGYNAHLKGMFDLMECPEADRRWIVADIRNRAEADGNKPILDALHAGEFKAINAIFKVAYREYMLRDQATAAGRDAVLAAQGKHKPLVQSNPMTVSGLPTDIKDVPQDKTDQWMEEQLDRLYAKK